MDQYTLYTEDSAARKEMGILEEIREEQVFGSPAFYQAALDIHRRRRLEDEITGLLEKAREELKKTLQTGATRVDVDRLSYDLGTTRAATDYLISQLDQEFGAFVWTIYHWSSYGYQWWEVRGTYRPRWEQEQAARQKRLKATKLSLFVAVLLISLLLLYHSHLRVR